MSVRMKITSGKTRSRRSHHALTAPTTTPTESGGVRRRHFADPATGTYRGRPLGKTLAKKTKESTGEKKAGKRSAKKK